MHDIHLALRDYGLKPYNAVFSHHPSQLDDGCEREEKRGREEKKKRRREEEPFVAISALAVRVSAGRNRRFTYVGMYSWWGSFYGGKPSLVGKQSSGKPSDERPYKGPRGPTGKQPGLSKGEGEWANRPDANIVAKMVFPLLRTYAYFKRGPQVWPKRDSKLLQKCFHKCTYQNEPRLMPNRPQNVTPK